MTVAEQVTAFVTGRGDLTDGQTTAVVAAVSVLQLVDRALAQDGVPAAVRERAARAALTGDPGPPAPPASTARLVVTRVVRHVDPDADRVGRSPETRQHPWYRRIEEYPPVRRRSDQDGVGGSPWSSHRQAARPLRTAGTG